MPMLSDGTIRRMLRDKKLVIDPKPDDERIQPASVDVLLDNEFILTNTHGIGFIDPQKGMENGRKISGASELYLHPGEFILGSTFEWVEIPNDVICQVNGKSSLGRMGLLVHATAGFVDPGFKGRITLELSNVATLPILLRPGMKIAQLTFMYLDRPSERPYGHPDLKSKYQNQITVRGASGDV